LAQVVFSAQTTHSETFVLISLVVTMKSAVAVFLMASPAVATKCSPGYTHKKDLTNLFCGNANTDSADCNDNCCEKDTKTCGGVGLTCQFGTYAKNDAAWKSTKTTAGDKGKTAAEKQATFQTDCCREVATCSSTLFTCPGGYKRKTALAVGAIHCPGDAASCANDVCCEKDPTTCYGWWKQAGGNTFCDTGLFPATANDAVLEEETWRAMKITGAAAAATFKASCCAPIPTCASTGYECRAGFEYDKAQAAQICDSVTNSNSKLEYTVDGCGKRSLTFPCCKSVSLLQVGVSTCANPGAAVACTAAQYAPTTDAWKSKKFISGKQNEACCTEKADCAVATCPSGWIKKKNVDTLSCPNDKASCATAAARCCELNKLTCGGLASSINCPYGFFSEAAYFTADTAQATKDAWNNKATTQATKNKDCCTAKAQCVAEGVTTTPVPAAATVTPAAPARLYTAHKAAATDKTQGASLLWLGAGAIMGMAVLMGVQSLRSSQTREVYME